MAGYFSFHKVIITAYLQDKVCLVFLDELTCSAHLKTPLTASLLRQNSLSSVFQKMSS